VLAGLRVAWQIAIGKLATLTGNRRKPQLPSSPTKFAVLPRSDAHEYYSVVTPNGCTLSLRPLREEEATYLAETLNRYVER
jgi:hypothetical protein